MFFISNESRMITLLVSLAFDSYCIKKAMIRNPILIKTFILIIIWLLIRICICTAFIILVIASFIIYIVQHIRKFSFVEISYIISISSRGLFVIWMAMPSIFQGVTIRQQIATSCIKKFFMCCCYNTSVTITNNIMTKLNIRIISHKFKEFLALL